MLTKNGKLCFGVANSSSTSVNYKNTSGNIQQYSRTNLLTGAGAKYIAVGTGIIPVTLDDYKLENINTDVTQISNVCTFPTNYGDDYIAIVSTTYKNNTESDITITELGFIITYNQKILMAREIIEPTIISANGGTKTFTIQIG